MSRVWFITGAGSGIGAGVANAALRAGDRVVATSRNLEKVRKVFADIASESIPLAGSLSLGRWAGFNAGVLDGAFSFET